MAFKILENQREKQEDEVRMNRFKRSLLERWYFHTGQFGKLYGLVHQEFLEMPVIQRRSSVKAMSVKG